MAEENLTTTCPQCGKQMTVSHEEIALRDGRVVCPQCLTAYAVAEPGEFVATGEGRGRSPAGGTPARRFCPHCGEAVGDGINFCPYCGGVLREHAAPAPATPAAVHNGRDEHESRHGHTRAGATHTRGNAASRRRDASDAASDTETESGFDWKPMIPSYRLARIQRRQPASLRFRAFAFAVIAALLALLGFIIYHAMRLL